MTESPELDEFSRRIGELAEDVLKPLIKDGGVHLKDLSLEKIGALLRDEVAYYFLIAAAGMNRTSLKRAMEHVEAKIVRPEHRRAFAILSRLPLRCTFAEVASRAIALRAGDLGRKARGGIEALFRERLTAEGIPLLMSPPVRKVPGILIKGRKPDGVFPDPADLSAPRVYLEIKNIRRPADDIQKRLYEVAEASIEMKFLYGSLKLEGLGLTSAREVVNHPERLRAKLRTQILAARPTVVVLMLCARADAEKYREGAEAFVDRVFFQEEIEDCLRFLKAAVAT